MGAGSLHGRKARPAAVIRNGHDADSFRGAMSTLIIEYESGLGHDGQSTAINLLLDDELVDAVEQTDQATLAGSLQTLELVELVRFCGRPGDLVAFDVPPEGVARFARRLDAMVCSGQLQ
jgi:hypothetical protein